MRARSANLVIRTARLTLRPPCVDDVAALVWGIGNYDVARWLGRVPFPYGAADARAFVEMTAAHPGKYWFIHDGQGLVGGISIDGELGYWLAREAWGRGYATEAGDAAVDAHFGDRAAGPLVSGHFLDNARSAGVLAKLGFVRDGLRTVASVALGQPVASQQLVLTRPAWAARRRLRLSTPRLCLREVRPSDRQAVARLLADAAPGRAEAWIEAARFRGRPGFHAVIAGQRTGRVLGTIGLAARDGVATLCLSVDAAHRRRGIGTEAARALLDDAVDRFGLAEVRAGGDDPAVAALLGRLGLFASVPRLESGADVLYRLDRSELKANP